jgi:hypothetical protein
VRLRLFAIAAAAALTCAPAGAQMAPGLRAPESVVDAVGDAWMMGCFFASSDRPAVGLNIGMELAGPSLHSADAIPDPLRPLINGLPARDRFAVLDAPGGQVWMFFDPKTKRCIVVPLPVDTPGIEAKLLSLMGDEWKQIPTREGVPAGTTVFEQAFPATPSLGRPAATLQVWYQPTGDAASPQMIVTERVRKKRN